MIGRFRQEETDVVEEPRGFDDFDLRLGDVMRGERATMGKSLLDVQRELKIKATYIAAIENADPSAFETPGFIAGYVRSYSRYLDLDPDWAFRAFCAESNFETAHGMSQGATARRGDKGREAGSGSGLGDVPLGLVPQSDSFLSRIEPGAIGSLLVLVCLIGGIGYGGYAVLKEVQKVQFVPVEEGPTVVADLDPLTSAQPEVPASGEAPAKPATPPEAFDRIYRPDALDVPVLQARDGPISTIDPKHLSPHPDATVEARKAGVTDDPTLGPTDAVVTAELEVPQDAPPVQVLAEAPPEVVLLAVRPSWVRVRAADGTVIYEQIMDEGDRFVLPQTEEPATLRTGESGAIYFAVNGAAYGPAGRSGAVTSNLPLDVSSLSEAYSVADPEADTALARVVAELEAEPPQLPSAAPETEGLDAVE